MSKKAHPEHYCDMIYLGLWCLVYEKDERERQVLITTTTVVTIRFQRTIFYPMPLTFPVLLLFQYAWDTNEEYLFKAMVAFSMRKVPNRETTE